MWFCREDADLSKKNPRENFLARQRGIPRSRQVQTPFRYFNSSPEIIRLAAMLYIRYPLSLREGEDMLFEGGIDICHETVRLWRSRLGLRV